MNDTPVPAVDPRALRKELSLPDPADIRSSGFLRFVIRLSEALNFDLPTDHHPRLVTVAGCLEYLAAHAPTRGGPT